MNKKVCQFIQLCPVDDATQEYGIVGPMIGKSWTRLESTVKAEFSEKEKQVQGNRVYEQRLTLTTYIGDYTLESGDYVARITMSDFHSYYWGTLTPFVPVEMERNVSGNYLTFNLQRDSSTPLF
jgi:hypothetical protein